MKLGEKYEEFIKNYFKNNSLFKFNQDSRLRGNDGISCFSGCLGGFAKVSACVAKRSCEAKRG